MKKMKELMQDKRLLLLLAALLCALQFVPVTQSGMTQEEKRIARTLSQIMGAGKVEVTVYYSESNSAFGGAKSCVGALAVCEGAGDIGVRLNVSRALETLLGLSSKEVVVLKMDSDNER